MLKIPVGNLINKYLNKSLFVSKKITEEDLSPILREIRIALLNSDVNLEVVKKFLDEIKQDLINSKNYGENEKLDVIVFKAIKKKLIEILGNKNSEISYSSSKLNKILLVGINGSGKTTTTAKLSYFLKKNYKAKVKNVSLDIYRPGAYEQLKKLSDSVDIPSLKVENGDFRNTIKTCFINSGKDDINCFLFDNFGLFSDNQKLIEEVIEIKNLINPTETIFVLDSMSGQEMLETVKLFHEKLNLTGIIATKTDSNSPMGAIFSISYILKLPIKFMGKGEKIEDLSVFYPERIAGLILGEGDILSLAEKMSENIDENSSKKFITRLLQGKFDLEDLVTQIKEVKKFGSLGNLTKFLPGNFSSKQFEGAESQLKIWEIIINSMTIQERRNPKLFKKHPNRKIRVISGSGRKPEEFNRLIKKWEESKKKMDEIVSRMKRGTNPLSFFRSGI